MHHSVGVIRVHTDY